MNSQEKLIKIIKAIKNSIEAKDRSTNILYHLQKEFPENKNIKKLFENEFDKNLLQIENILKEEKSEIDRRKVEYRLDELNKLFEKYIKFCKKHVKNINCRKIISQTIIFSFIENKNSYGILSKIENSLKNTFLPSKEPTQKDDRYMMLRFCSTSMFSKSPEEIFIETEFQNIKGMLDLEKLDEEIKLVRKLLQSFLK